MRIKSQDEILDAGIRKKIIEEIEGNENKERKYRHFKRHQLLKDQTEYFVIDHLERQFDKTTVYEMSFAVSNVSLYRKVIDKLARVYNAGVDRGLVNEEGVENETETEKLEKLADQLCVNSRQKTLNKYLKAHKNTAMYVKPCPNEDGTYELVLQPMAPYLYDVVEHYYDRTKPMVYVLSNYDYKTVKYTTQDPSKEGRTFEQTVKPPLGNMKDEVIADNPLDAEYENKEYIWWSDKYHFTTNGKGEIISEGTDNPIDKMPFINYAIDQDNQFWALGGDDLAESAVRINSQITHLNYIGQLQGYGQFFYSGKNPPTNMVVGPNKGIVLRYEEGDPEPTIGFASANPQLADLQAQIEMQVALVLTTNNLSTSGVATNLGRAESPASGISLIIDKAESMEDVQEQQELFLDNEPVMWEIINKWLQLYGSEGTLAEDLQGLSFPDDLKVNLEFKPPQIIMSEKEKLEAIQLRKDLGLNSMEELMKIDRPGISDQEAMEKLKKIQEERTKRMKDMSSAGVNPPNGAQDASKENGSQQKPDELGAGPLQ